MKNPFKKSYSQEELKLFIFLKRTRLFQNLTYGEMALFVPYLFPRDYTQNEAVFFRGDPSHALYIIKSGRVCMNIDLEGKFEVLTEMYAGTAFGDNCLLEDTKRFYSATVISESAKLYVIPQVNIQEIFEANVEIKAKMLESFSRMYNNYSENLFKVYRSSFGFFNLADVYKVDKDS